MKRLFTLLAAITLLSTASAQTLASYDFENGNNEGWTVWNKQSNPIVGSSQAKDSSHAYQVKVGTFFNVRGVKTGECYVISADTKYVWGEEPPMVRVEYYNSKSEKLEVLHQQKLPTDKAYTKFTTEFIAKAGVIHRVTFSCTPDKPCSFILDNVKVEKKQ